MNRLLHSSPLALVFAITACTVGPDYKRPDTPMPMHFARADDKNGAAVIDTLRTSWPPIATDQAVPKVVPGETHEGDSPWNTELPDASFWRGFGDPTLRALIAQALSENRDLQTALARYDASNALLREARFDQIPTVTANAEIGHHLTSKDQAFGASRSERDTPKSGASVNASWELDLFGRVRRGVEAHREETMASAADLRAVRVALAGEVAAAYIDLRGQQARLGIARGNAENLRDTLMLIEARFSTGRGTELDVARARAQYDTTLSRIPAFEAAVGFDEHRLAVLTGHTPDALISLLDTPGPLPEIPAGINPGTPADLLRRRPDVAAAEARLHAATARIGVSTAELFPRFTLASMVGSMTGSYGFFREGSDQNLIALGIDWSFLDVGRVRARIAASDAQAAAQLAQYQKTVLDALEDTENALLRAQRVQQESAALDRAAVNSERAAQIAKSRFSAGAIDYFQVLDVQRVLLQDQDAAAESRMRGAAAAVTLYRALAGGWEPTPSTPG